MIPNTMGRRDALRLFTLTAAAVMTGACQPTVVTDTAESAEEQIVAVGEEATVSKAETTAPAPSGKTLLRVMTRSGADGDSHREFLKRFSDENPEVDVEDIETTYNDIQTKTEAMHGAGTAPDVGFHSIRWYASLVYRDLFLPLDDLASAHWEEYDFDDYFPLALDAHTYDGKLYGLCDNLLPTSRYLIFYNIDLFEEAGVEPPADLDWDVYDWLEAATKLTNVEKGIFGGRPPQLENYYDWDAFVDGFDSHIVDQDVGSAKRFNFLENPKNKEAVDWYLEFVVKRHAAPLRGEQLPGVDMFVAGQAASHFGGLFNIRGYTAQIADKFKWGIARQRGPARVGSGLITNMWGISTQSKHVDVAFKLLAQYLSGKEIGLWSFKTGIGQGLQGRKSQWYAQEVNDSHPIWSATASQLERGLGAEGDVIKPFPMLWNLRHYELFDKYQNLIDPLRFGESAWEDQAPLIQSECQQIMDLPRP